jgi:glycosyltransferase involved in cell wall biosynthesis
MKVVYIVPTLDMDEGGGILEFLYLLIKYLDHSYYNVEILVFYSSEADGIAFEKSGATVHIASSKKEANNYLLLFRWLSAKIRELQPQIVHTNIYWADTLGREVAFKCGVPILITTEHNTNLNETPDQRQVKKRLSLKTDAIVCNTNSVRDYSIKVDQIDAAKLEVIPCAFNFARYAKGIQDISCLSKKFYFVGRLVDQKKPLELISVFASIIRELPECKLICVGEGPLRKECQVLVESLNMTDSIALIGYRNNPFESVAPGSIFVLNSSFEGQGIVLLEAMAQGLICVASDCGGVPDVITHQENGFLFRTNDQAALKNTIYQVLSMDMNRLNALRHKAYTEVVEKYNPEKIAGDYMKVYQRLLRNKLSV